MCVALLAAIVIVHAVVVVLRRGQHGAAPSAWAALNRLGVALGAVPVVWMFTLVFFEEQPVDVIGPGPVVVLVGGLLVAVLSRAGLAADEQVTEDGPTAWPRWSTAADIALVLGPMALAFVVFLCGVGTVPAGSPLTPLAATDASSFIGYLGAVAGVAAWLSRLGVFGGLAGPFARHRRLAYVFFGLLVVAFPLTQQGSTFWVRVGAQAATWP